jgi:acyl-coenzyme A thioesterase PaaI-like protein
MQQPRRDGRRPDGDHPVPGGRAARVGQRLVAEAQEARQGKRAGFYTMIVKDDEDGTVVATCQAVSFRPAANQPR